MDISVPGFMGPEELEQIARWAREVPANGVIVEVGSYLGRSACAWAMADPTVKIYCIDYFKHMDEFINNTAQYPNIIPIKGQSPNAIRYPGDLIDIFFLDAAHNNPSDILNIKYFLPLIKPGGLLCGHDYQPEWPEVVENVQWLEKELGKPVTLYPHSTLWSFTV